MTNEDSQLNRIDHIVVLMLENRSFDNVLGWLYDKENKPPFDKVPRGQKFEGLSGAPHCNPGPKNTEVCVGKGKVMTDPFPDPNEPYDHVYTQMYNKTYPKNCIPITTDVPPMSGFVNDYANAIHLAGEPKRGCSKILSSIIKGGGLMAYDPGIIMNCFTPDRLPVMNGLANAYAVCDHWYSSVPTQTFPNRSFIHAATSSGYVYNMWTVKGDPFDDGILINKTTTIYNLLEQARVDWRIYYGGPLLLCNALIIQERLWDFLPFDTHFFQMRKFYEDVKRPGGLPSYTFIEPNMLCSSRYGPENDMHPAYAVIDTGAPTDVRYGEALVYEVYEALRNSPDWNSTLLVITFDEHGGTYDHFPPEPGCCSPDGIIIPADKPGGSGFNFERYGVRVPAVLVSPLIEQGTVCNAVFDHTSVIKTVSDRWLKGQHLTERDKNASGLGELITLSTPRTDVPNIIPNPIPLFTTCQGAPLSDLHKHMMAGAKRHVETKTGERVDLSHVHTTDQAVELFDELESKVRR